jgi:hypothetical protein
MSSKNKIIEFLENKDKINNLLTLISKNNFEGEIDFDNENIKINDLDITLNGKIKFKVGKND